MSRPLRIEYKDAWYHVMNRGRRQEEIFLDKEDYQSFLKVLKEAVELWKVNICAYCLMPNYYHLLVQTPDANISRCMRHINGVYTQRFNRRHGMDGQLFRGRFKSILIGEEHYLLELLRYICFDPVKAGLVKKPEFYKWSSFNDYLSDKNENEWLNRDLIIQKNGGEKGKRKIDASLLKKDASEDIYEFFGKKNVLSILGSYGFVNQIRRNHLGDSAYPEKPDAKELMLKAEAIMDQVCQFYNIDDKELTKHQRGAINVPRDITMYLIRKQTGHTLNEIGSMFDISSYSTVSSAIERMKVKLSKDEKIRNLLMTLESKLEF
ncbi:transposase [bacterium]|nr:transposase [bacterium]